MTSRTKPGHQPTPYPLTIKGIDPNLRHWLVTRAAAERRSIGSLLNDIIELYRDQVGWSQANAPRQPNHHPSLTIRGLNLELWQWLKDRAAQENKIPGDLINDLLTRYLSDQYSAANNLPLTSPVSDPDYIISIKGIDRTLWEHLKAGAALEQKTIGEALNQLIDWYRRQVL